MSGRKIPVVILVRVSTVKQETDRQISELRAYAKVKGYDVVEICRETISGTADGDDHHGLKRAEALAIEGKVKKVLVHEISRVAEGIALLITLLKCWRIVESLFIGMPKGSKRSCQMANEILPPG